MKHYPSITRCDPNGIDEHYYTYCKYDGSCIRAEYSKAKGFYKFGSRQFLIDEQHHTLGGAIPLFKDTLAEPLIEIFQKNKWKNVVVFAEYWGDESLAGRHKVDDKKHITMFDVSVYKQGMLPQKDFLRLFQYLPIPHFFGVRKWDKDFVDSVRASSLKGITLEGVVGKAGEYNHLQMVKCKTQNWLDAIRRLYSEDEARRLIES